MRAEDLRWEAPGPGLWFSSPEHMPTPGCTLLVELLPHAGRGWQDGTEAYGLPPNPGTFGASNRWFFFSPGQPAPAWTSTRSSDRRAAETLATRRWRVELQRWHREVRPQVVAANRAFLSVDLPALDDVALADQVRRSSPTGWRCPRSTSPGCRRAVCPPGALLHATGGWGLDPQAVLLALAGLASASSSVERLLERIADGPAGGGRRGPDLSGCHPGRRWRRGSGPRRAPGRLRVADLPQRPARADAWPSGPRRSSSACGRRWRAGGSGADPAATRSTPSVRRCQPTGAPSSTS